MLKNVRQFSILSKIQIENLECIVSDNTDIGTHSTVKHEL